MSISIPHGEINCDGLCGRGEGYQGTAEAAIAKLRRDGWTVIGESAVTAICYCPECVKKRAKGDK